MICRRKVYRVSSEVSFNCVPIGCGWSMHVLANLANSEAKIRSSNGTVLQSSNNLPVGVGSARGSPSYRESTASEAIGDEALMLVVGSMKLHSNRLIE